MKLERIIPSCLIRDTRIAISKKKKLARNFDSIFNFIPLGKWRARIDEARVVCAKFKLTEIVGWIAGER